MKNSLPQIFVGVDVSKADLDVHLYPLKKDFRVANTKDGIRKLETVLSDYNVGGQIVCESTGGYEALLKKTLKNYKLWIVMSRRIRAFIVSEGINAKTDKIDAAMIALFASQKRPKHDQVEISQDQIRLKALNQRRFDIIDMITEESNRFQHPAQCFTKNQIKNHLSFLKDSLKNIDSEIEVIIKNSQVLAKRDGIIQSVPGVGKVTASTLLSFMPELGTIGDKQIAALAGVAPFDRQSGYSRRSSIIKGGRPEVRKVLYMAAVVASCHNPKLKLVYDRLRTAGKEAKVALVAVMRKLLTILNTMVKNETVWNSLPVK